MNELIQKLVQEVGITEEQATKSLDTITKYIKAQLPPMMHEMIDNFLSGGNKKQDDDFLG